MASFFGNPASHNKSHGIVLGQDGKIMVASSTSSSMQLDRFNMDGTRDADFANTYTTIFVGSSFDPVPCGTVQQPDGK